MAVWEPTAEEFASFKTLTDVVSWSKMLPEVSDSFMDSIGASGQEHPCVLGMMEHEEVQEVIKDLKVGYKSLNLMQKGHIRTVMHVCKLVAGTETTANVQKELEGRLNQVVTDITKVAEEAKAAAASQSEKVGGPQVPLKHVVSQGSEETVPKISAEEMTKHCRTDFRRYMEGTPDPREPSAQPTNEQVSTLYLNETWPRTWTSGSGAEPSSPTQEIEKYGSPTPYGRCSASYRNFGPPGSHSTSGIFCPVHTGSVHQCSKGLAEEHGGNACNLTPREPSYGKGRGKKGKGRGKRHD